jgi:hypothetical protein
MDRSTYYAAGVGSRVSNPSLNVRYHPIGIGFCCRPAADHPIAEATAEMTDRGQLDDPLFRFTWELENQRCEAFSETVNLAPLFTASAAVGRIWRSPLGRDDVLDRQRANADRGH